ncbi:MAG TPA: CDP-diacylglycerol--glycerol-3-phosphate 3-phosphatidyltransferase [Deltaproteobacteria bacterium]|nr:CDP-diacylglycerol--glycerol-3-phosphate 3-phosphatidyltransferase [Deltaproteobacteria bacterium]
MIDFLKDSFDKLPISGDKKDVLNLPNTITMVRIGVIPILFLLLINPGRALSLVIAVLFILAAITDLLDGYVARKYGIVTRLGKYLDPLADKLIVNTAMILMIPIGRIPAWIVAIIIMRDLAVDGLRSIASTDDLVIHASTLGKQKTLCQVIAVSALLIHYPLFGADAHAVGIAVLYIALILTIWSGVDYFVKFLKTQ